MTLRAYRDPRRLFSSSERSMIAARQHHACHECGAGLPEVYHVHHVVPWAEGGRTHPDNGVALCPECHLRVEVKLPPAFEPRAWQEEALPNILPLLRGREFATLSAAPGAGKTEFTAWAYTNLRATGDALRLVVFGPNTHLRGQWRDVCANRRIFLRHDSISERRGEDGVVVTYHALLDPNRMEQLIEDAAATPTLFVLDEVHHLAKTPGGEAGAWAVNIGRVVGTVDNPQHAVLNLSGTLFRSKRSERISTIKYEQVGEQIQTVADYSITAGRLISELQLRHIKVLGFDAEMKVSPVDLVGSAHQGATAIRAIDLDDDDKLRSKILPEMIRTDRFVKGIISETVGRLGHASVALEGAPVKGLIIADGIPHANQIHTELVSQVGASRAFLAHGGTSDADREIERFRNSGDQAIMVAVQKVTEGFDVPDICVLTYLRTWRAPLFINQMVGRAMRITDKERQLGNYLPATVIVPNDADVKAAFADVLVGAMNVLEVPPEPCEICGREICACPPRPRRKVCLVCGQPWKICVCKCSSCGKSRYEGCMCYRPPSPLCNVCGKPARYCVCPAGPPSVDLLEDPELAAINVDGQDVDLHIAESIGHSMADIGIPAIFHEQAAAAAQKTIKADPMTYLSYLKGDEER